MLTWVAMHIRILWWYKIDSLVTSSTNATHISKLNLEACSMHCFVFALVQLMRKQVNQLQNSQTIKMKIAGLFRTCFRKDCIDFISLSPIFHNLIVSR